MNSRTKTNLKSFFSTLLPSFQKSNLITGLEAQFKELALNKEMYESVDRELVTVMNENYSALGVVIDKYHKRYNNDILGTIKDVIDLRLKEQVETLDFIDKIYSKVEVRDVMDYRKIQMLRYVDALEFFVEYSRFLIIDASNILATKLSKDANVKLVTSVIDKEEREFIRNPDNIKAMGIATGALANEIKNIQDLLHEISNVTFEPLNHDVIRKDTANKTDPLQLGFMPIIGSITYRVGLAINTFTAMRQEKAINERDKLKVKVLMLNRLRETEVDKDEVKSLAKQVSYYDNRINKLQAKIDDLTGE